MTASELGDLLVEFITMNTSELRYRSNEMAMGETAPQVYTGFIPRNQVNEIIPGEIGVYPAIIVCTKLGVQSTEYEKVTAEIIFACFDDSKDQQGYRDVLQLIERVKQRLREQSVVRRKLPVRLPLNWQLNPRGKGAGAPTSYNQYPYFFGEMQVDFQVPVPESQYVFDQMTPESGSGRFDVPMTNYSEDEQPTPTN